jgi:hypothetical protein
LEAILRRGMDTSDLPSQARRRPHAQVSVQLETLLGMGGAGVALLHRFGIIPTHTAARVACDAAVRLVVTHGRAVLNVGHSQRVVTDAQHAALAHRHHTCVVPGCAIRFADCHIHHTWWWALAGPTDLDLQLPLCGSHHRWVHDHGLTLTLHDGLLEFRDPKGRVITNTQQVLAGQLDLLHQQRATGPAHEHRETTGRAEHAEKLLAEAAADADGWPDSPYRHGTWGWTGHNPAPPPGHGPPQAS